MAYKSWFGVANLGSYRHSLCSLSENENWSLLNYGSFNAHAPSVGSPEDLKNHREMKTDVKRIKRRGATFPYLTFEPFESYIGYFGNNASASAEIDGCSTHRSSLLVLLNLCSIPIFGWFWPACMPKTFSCIWPQFFENITRSSWNSLFVYLFHL